MKRSISTTWHYFNRLSCTLLVVMGLLGIVATASQAARRDTTAPTVSITSPTSGTSITSAQTVRISASASDNVGISKVDLYDGTTLLKNDTTSPYYFDWAITSAKNGNHNLTAKAYDAAGNLKVSTAVAVSINIPVPDLTAPTVAFTSPTAATTYLSAQTVTISANASDNVGVSKVDFYNGTTLLKNDTTSPYYFDWAISSANNGSHSLTAKAYDAAGNIKVSTAVAVTINIPVPDLTAPTVSLTSPASGTTFTSAQTMTIGASASDNIGVSKVELYNGSTLMGTDTTSPYSFAWAISSANNGSYSLTAKAYDAAANVTSSTAVAINVSIAVDVSTYAAPVLNSVTISNGNYLLSWTLPTTAYGVPAGGYDVFTDGVDDNLHHTTLSAVKSGLPLDIEHCFAVEARWTQIVPSAFPASNKICILGTQSLDVTAPTVSLTSPATGTTFTSAQTVRIAADASDNVGISKVDLYDGTTLLKNDITSPYYFDWAITSANNGSHNLTAKAYDAAGNLKISTAVAVTVNIPVTDLSAPSVSLTNPISGVTYASAQTISIAATAQDNVGVTRVEFFDGMKLLGTDTAPPFNYLWSISNIDNGTHVLTCKVYDAAGNTSSSNPATVSININASSTGPLRVFPGAEGFGTTTPAGRGGQIIKVTNLNDNGTGSLRAAVQATGARIVVFEVSGTIVLSSNLIISNPFITIAGQTSPSPGITLRRGALQVHTHDVLVQHIRIRVGDETGGPSLPDRDGLDVDSGSYNVVIDHCSISWAIDENIAVKHVKDVTISNTIVSECLNNSYNAKGAHSKAILIAYSAKNVSIVKNFMPHNADRHPNFKDDSTGLSLNNLYYNFGYRAFATSYNEAPYATTDPLLYSDVGNVYKAGPDTDLVSSGVDAIYHIHSSVVSPSKIYLADYLFLPSSFLVRRGGAGVLVDTPPIWDNSLTIMPSNTVESYVLANAGARPADRDIVDKRLVEDAKSVRGSIIDTPGQVGGWPTLQNNYRLFSIPTNPNGDENGNGYTNIEEILHQLAAQVEGRTTP